MAMADEQSATRDASEAVGQQPQPRKHEAGHHQSFWLFVMCLTGVDYFSTLGYLPYIAYISTGELAPIATVLLVAVTLGGALPIYIYVAQRSPNGMGSLSLLERLVKGWEGKFLVLTILGFVATAFIFTKTLSAADAAEHLVQNPLLQNVPFFSTQGLEEGERLHVEHRQRLFFTMVMLVILGASFLRGFREVIGLAVGIVAVFLTLNLIIIGSGIYYVAVVDPAPIHEWITNLGDPQRWEIETPFHISESSLLIILGLCLFYFPNLALGLSGFETGLMVMPLIKGDPTDTKESPRGRIRNTRKLLTTAALIMSVLLLGSSFVTATLIPPSALQEGGPAENRALAYLAHGQSPYAINPWLFGPAFGTIYDLATIVILWFAGASAMAGLLNLVPQYLPRYGMAPEWAKALRPLILLFTAINLAVTWIYNADVTAQSGEYATGVLVFIFSGCTATLLDRWASRPKKRKFFWALSLVIFGLITIVFLYATISIMINQPDGILIALLIILMIIVASMISRTVRSTELRFTGFTFVDERSRFLWDSLKHIEFPVLVPHRPGVRSIVEKEASIRAEHRLTPDVPVVFLEVELGDVSEFWQTPQIEITQEEGRFIIRVRRAASIAHVIAAIGLELSKYGKPPEIHFGWSDESPVAANLNFLLFGEGNVPWMVRSLIVREQPDPARQPRIVIG